MRADALGLWWGDEPVIKAPAAPQGRRTPPKPVWLAPDYLPGLAEARAFNVHVLTDVELMAAHAAGERFVFDTECYSNYWCIAFMSIKTGHVAYFEQTLDHPLDINRVGWIMTN